MSVGRKPVARPKSQRVQNHLQRSPQSRAATMANSYALSTYLHRVQSEAPTGATGWLCDCRLVQLMMKLYPMHPPGYGPGYSITSGIRCWCHLGRISAALALQHSITSGARCWCHLGRISAALALRHSITSGARCWCHLGRRISEALALRYSITSGARC